MILALTVYFILYSLSISCGRQPAVIHICAGENLNSFRFGSKNVKYAFFSFLGLAFNFHYFDFIAQVIIRPHWPNIIWSSRSLALHAHWSSRSLVLTLIGPSKTTRNNFSLRPSFHFESSLTQKPSRITDFKQQTANFSFYIILTM